MMSMGMGFPDLIIDKEMPKVEKQVKSNKVSKMANMACSREVYSAKTEKKNTNTQHTKQSCVSLCPSNTAVTSIKDIYLKLFDKKGNLLLTENLKIEEFLSSNYPAQNLPAGSIFVMFHGNTAYYYLENTQIH